MDGWMNERRCVYDNIEIKEQKVKRKQQQHDTIKISSMFSLMHCQNDDIYCSFLVLLFHFSLFVSKFVFNIKKITLYDSRRDRFFRFFFLLFSLVKSLYRSDFLQCCFLCLVHFSPPVAFISSVFGFFLHCSFCK